MANKDITKEFIIPFKNNNSLNFAICRGDYESMPIPLKAIDFSDLQMEQLAKNIASALHQHNFDEESDYFEEKVYEAFWREMEDCAVNMGMVYYEDID